MFLSILMPTQQVEVMDDIDLEGKFLNQQNHEFDADVVNTEKRPTFSLLFIYLFVVVFFCGGGGGGEQLYWLFDTSFIYCTQTSGNLSLFFVRTENEEKKKKYYQLLRKIFFMQQQPPNGR